MIDCAYIGDGIAIELQKFEPTCGIYAKPGANSDYVLKHYSKIKSDWHVVISVGSIQPNNPNNFMNALLLRSSITARRVVWILPYNQRAALDIRRVANIFNDGMVDLKGQNVPTSDGVHPNYRRAMYYVDINLNIMYDD